MLKELESRGLKVQVKTTNSDTKDKDIIISQSPKQTEVNEGSTVELMVSKGKDKKIQKRTRILLMIRKIIIRQA